MPQLRKPSLRALRWFDTSLLRLSLSWIQNPTLPRLKTLILMKDFWEDDLQYGDTAETTRLGTGGDFLVPLLCWQLKWGLLPWLTRGSFLLLWGFACKRTTFPLFVEILPTMQSLKLEILVNLESKKQLEEKTWHIDLSRWEVGRRSRNQLASAGQQTGNVPSENKEPFSKSPALSR